MYTISVDEYRDDPGSYELRVEDSDDQEASEKIDVDPPKIAYRTIHLNGKTWTAQNLNIDVPGSWCYEGKLANCQKYGRLYTWQAAKDACKKLGPGWRLPRDEEWSALMDKYGGNAGAYKALIQGGSTGFDALLSGYRYPGGTYDDLQVQGYFWSESEWDAQYAWSYGFLSQTGMLYRLDGEKLAGISCRCLQSTPSKGID